MNGRKKNLSAQFSDEGQVGVLVNDSMGLDILRALRIAQSRHGFVIPAKDVQLVD